MHDTFPTKLYTPLRVVKNQAIPPPGKNLELYPPLSTRTLPTTVVDHCAQLHGDT